jgi:3-oxoadipate CoA-transferase, alpha subunit
MANKIFADPDSALEGVFDGAIIMFGGFASAGSPSNLILALKRRGTRSLTGIANNIGLGDKLDELCEAHQLRKMIASFAIRATGSRHSLFEEQYRRGEVELELVPQGTLAERMRAAGAGIPGFYTPTGAGTLIANGKETKTFDDREYLLERALPADFALIKADTADRIGNLTYHGTGRNFNPVMATAAKTVIVEVRRIVEIGELDPEMVVTPGVYVDRIVQCDPISIRWHA